MSRLNFLFENSELIAKRIAGKLTNEEEIRFNQWLNESKTNQTFFDRVSDLRNFHRRNNLYESINKEKAWSAVSEKLSIANSKTRLSVFFKFAAIIFFSLITSTTLFWVIREKPEKEQVIVSGIGPGSKNAILVLSDGKRVNLSQSAKVSLKEADGTVIEKKNDELYYDNKRVKEEEQIYDKLIVPQGGEYTLVLSDGTKVFVNSMSELSFPVQFSGSAREVILEGEAYFEVTKDDARPFGITVDGIQIKVLGTSLNIKAYQDEDNIYTTLVEGSVRVNTLGQDTAEYLLVPDQQAVFHKVSNTMTVQDVDADLYRQWINGRYIFTDQSLGEILKTLSRWYDFSYLFSDESIRNMRFQGGFNKYESIDPVLDIITRTGKVEVQLKGKEVLFSRKIN